MSNFIPRLEFFLQSFFRRQRHCPHCKSDRLVRVAQKYGIIGINQCEECYLFFTSPIYKSYLSPNFYDTLYQGSGSVTKLPGLGQLKIWTKDDFQSSDRNFSLQLGALSRLSRNGHKKLLEIGSSWGYFLYQGRQKGFNVTGIEIADKRRLFGNEKLGLHIVKDFSELRETLFDIVYASHVLEHFSDLSHIFKDIYSHLKPYGKLVIEVPNFDYRHFGSKLKKIIGAVHPLGFFSKFFIFNLPKYGFEIRGLFNDWADFPGRPTSVLSSAFLIVLAEKR